MGFVSRVVHGGLKGVEQEALKMGGLIASKSPIAVLGTKNILNCKSLMFVIPVAILQPMSMATPLLQIPETIREQYTKQDWARKLTICPSLDSIEDGLNYTAAWNM